MEVLKLLIILILSIYFNNNLVESYGEPNLRGFPTWFERSNLVLVNAVRIAPRQYLRKYTNFADQDILSPSIYPSVHPLYFEFTLGSSALSHARDMSYNGCFSHDSCDGTDSDSRINQFYSCSDIHGENIAAGYDSPLITNNQWVCDDGSDDPYSSNRYCPGDASGSDGHRKNIMSPDYQVIGIGYSFTIDSTYHSYWTQDFGQLACNNITQPIHSGSHLYLESGKITFMVDWYDEKEPSASFVVISGKKYQLSLDMGSKSKGIYITHLPIEKKCRDYYFYFEKSITTNTTNTTIQVTDKGNITFTSYSFSTSTEIFRYPDFGYLQTFGEGGCKKSYSINGTEFKPFIPTIIPTLVPIHHDSSENKNNIPPNHNNPSNQNNQNNDNNNKNNSNNNNSSNNNRNSDNNETSKQPENNNSKDTSSSPLTTSSSLSSLSSSSSLSSTYTTFDSSLETSFETFNAHYRFLGCFNDELAHDLPFNEIFSLNMTNEKCEAYCARNNFKYSGTELGTQCYCGNKYGTYGKAKQSDCSIKCGGNKREYCGGNDKISVFKTSYNGCHSYEPLIAHFSISATSDNMTIESCKSYCFSKHFSTAGLARGYVCLCGNNTLNEQQDSSSSSINNLYSEDTNKCSIKCSGSAKEFCGGENEISLYSTENLLNILVPTDFNDTSINLPQSSNNSYKLLNNNYNNIHIFILILLILILN